MKRLEPLRADVLKANLEIERRGLALFSFGNASGIIRDLGLVVIKPSGVSYDQLTPADLVVTDMDGRIVEGSLRPSTDLPTHLALYKAFPFVGGVVHTHSRFATVWAQAGLSIPCLGTTHVDYFRGPVPVTEPMQPAEIQSDYEWNTGQAIVRRMVDLDPHQVPAALVTGHAPFCWGASPGEAADLAAVLEEIARIAYHTVVLNPNVEPLSAALRDKHFLRKHGPGAYYGQTR
jgi:L-ribulose-5-phosphate 4-epimerase